MTDYRINDFYLLCDSAHREFYSVLLWDWQEMGLAWQCDEKAVLLGINSVARGGMFVCFSLYAGGAEPASIRLDTRQWREQLGQECMADFTAGVRRLQGLSCAQREDVFSIENPGHMLPPVQKELRHLIHQFGVSLPNRMAA